MQDKPQHRPVRLEDIAEKLGVTKMSVSKALRDHADIPKSTRELIKKTAKEMGYLPNRFARSLTSARSNMLGIVVPRVSHSFFSNVIDAIESSASEKGYEMLLTMSQEDPQRERDHLRTLLSMRVDGILVSSCMTTDDYLDIYEQVEKVGVPLVFFDRCRDPMSFGTVTTDDRKGAYEAVSLALSKGSRNIAHIAGHSGVNIGRDRYEGYVSALRDNGIEPDDALVVEGGFDEIAGYFGMRELLGRGARLDTVLCVSFPVMVGAIDAIREIRPERLEKTLFIFFGERGLRRFLDVPYICVNQGAEEIGEEAVSSVLAAIDGERVVHKSIEITLSTSEDAVLPQYAPGAEK